MVLPVTMNSSTSTEKKEQTIPRKVVSDVLSEARKKEIFAALVNAQDQRMSVEKSRRLIADHFRVSVQEILLIEEEGMDHGWPPL